MHRQCTYHGAAGKGPGYYCRERALALLAGGGREALASPPGAASGELLRTGRQGRKPQLSFLELLQVNWRQWQGREGGKPIQNSSRQAAERAEVAGSLSEPAQSSWEQGGGEGNLHKAALGKLLRVGERTEALAGSPRAAMGKLQREVGWEERQWTW